jgi:exonuclease SbcC
VERQDIDFGRFSDAGVFLIHGNTGSGKTTILDAMSFALYGKSSGGQRGDITDMRCQLAEPDNLTTVEFIFCIKDKTYKFTREVRVRKKRTGALEYLVSQNAMYMNESGIFTPFFENPKIKDVEQKACELIGLNHEQFIQVIMLPQGKFEKLLVAKSDEKEEILVTLFNAQKWQEAAEWICSEAKNLKKEMEIVQENISMMLKNENADDIEGMNGQKTSLAESLEKLCAEKIETEKLLSKERELLENQNTMNNRFLELDRLKDEYIKITGKEEEIKKLSVKFEKGKKSLNVSPKHEALCSSYKELKRIEVDLEKEQNKFKILTSEKNNIAMKVDQLKKVEERFAEKRTKKIEFNNLREVYGKISSAAEDAREQTAKHEKISGELKNKRALYESAKERLKQCSERKDFIFNSYSIRLPELREKCEKILRIEDKSLEMVKTNTEISKFDEKIERYKRILEKNKKALDKYQAEYEKKYHQYLDSAAYLLGESLEEGQECPVCGSMHHPRKAVSAESTVDASEIKEMAGSIESMKNKLSEQANELLKCETSRSMMIDKVNTLNEDIKTLRSFLDSESSENIKSGLKKAEEENKKLEALTSEEKNLREAALKLEAEINDLASKLEGQTKIREESLAKYNSLSNRKVEGIEDEKGLLLKLKEISDEIEGYDNRLRELNDKNNEAGNALSSSKTAISLMSGSFETKSKEYEDIKTLYANSLAENGFEDTDEFKSFLIRQSELEELEKEIHSYRLEKESVKKNIERFEELTKGFDRPDIESIRAVVAELENKFANCSSQTVLFQAKIENLDKIINIVSKDQNKLKNLTKKYDSYYSFGITLRGDRGISLRRYVLGVMLSSVTAEANRLLKNVHEGRYQLCRTLEGTGRARKAGLELEVIDSYSGEKRSVSGLSGGEKFLVSLALSLGLSAVVQSQSGNIRIDTMFIDEGFGSLDSSSIADALGILSSVRGSKRLVGIISHVQILKETIETSIQVDKDRNGSRIIINA